MALFKPVSALERGLSVLEVVSQLGRARVTDLREETGLDKATIIRMLETFIHLGYVEKRADDTTYAITGRTVALGRGFQAQTRLAELVNPAIQAFRSDIGWPSDFAVPDGLEMSIVETGGAENSLISHRPAGYRPDLLVASLGLAYFAFCDDAEQQRLLEKIAAGAPPVEARKLLDDPAKLTRLFKRVRTTGYANSDPDYVRRFGSETIWPMAVPVTDRRRVYGSVSLFIVKSSVSEKEAVAKYLAPLQAFADQLMESISKERESFPSAPYYAPAEEIVKVPRRAANL
jgi:IclR family mhp operon transcriptional activator